jgi:hypothetical protein
MMRKFKNVKIAQLRNQALSNCRIEQLCIQLKQKPQEIKFPSSFINPICEIAEEWHNQIVAVKLRILI